MLRSTSSTSAALALALLLLHPHVAAAVVVDPFDDEFAVEIGIGDIAGNPKTATGGVAVGGAIGGSRAVVVQRVTGGGSASVDTGYSEPSTAQTLTVSTGAGSSVQAKLIYDGDTGESPNEGVNTSGLGSQDMTAGGASLLSLDASWDQAGIVIRVSFFQGTLSSYYDFVTVGGNTLGTFQSLTAPFTSFTAGPGGGVDFDDIGAITVDITGPTAFDLQLRNFETTVPEPGTLALLALGLAGLRYAGSRHRA